MNSYAGSHNNSSVIFNAKNKVMYLKEFCPSLLGNKCFKSLHGKLHKTKNSHGNLFSNIIA